MRIIATVKTKAKENKVTIIEDGHFLVTVTALPVKGAANIAIIKTLSDYFHVPKSNIKIVIGKTAKEKIIEIIKD